MRKLLPIAMAFGLSAVAIAQDSNTRLVDGKLVQEDHSTINITTPAPGNSSVSTYATSWTDSDSNTSREVVVTRNGTTIQTTHQTINKVMPAPAYYRNLRDGYVMTPADNSVSVRVDKNGTVIQEDRNTINKITPMSSNTRTTVVTESNSTGMDE